MCLHTIAHEIRNPLVSIQGFASLLQEKYSRYLPREGKQYLERITANTKRVETLISDITKLAKVSIDESSFDKVSANEIIDAALDSHFIQLNQRNIELSITRNLPELYCDSNAMILVFSNLIGNAIKYSRDKLGSQIQIGYLNDEIFHKFFIRDNGVGFRACDRNKVFRLFGRLPNKGNVSGSGLGLSIVKQVIEGHGGEVWVESGKNRGSTFFFTLPKNFP